jgi:hypothetical protein
VRRHTTSRPRRSGRCTSEPSPTRCIRYATRTSIGGASRTPTGSTLPTPHSGARPSSAAP